ncbi:hypothetical protein Pcaca03_38480 [Pectobacterium carotovorum subsp. carotovorum]|uniref:Uncharacterized protein n=1 Tax=Pectobacterium carotovorum subsp. carotovorum TaxID=555 RepID=A0AAI9PFC4_PECCC|nr:hypothetical protein SOASR016_36710 [Pectobacterium carotovorum subsp. carotovorum]GLV71404.1 hypothetical protein Pcaca03_38480 [Pectobacterium carotovorum subsp. carotovorum]
MIATPTDSDNTTRVSPNPYKAIRPTADVMKCPPMTFLGCANGDADAANKMTHVAPKGAINQGTPLDCPK